MVPIDDRLSNLVAPTVARVPQPARGSARMMRSRLERDIYAAQLSRRRPRSDPMTVPLISCGLDS